MAVNEQRVIEIIWSLQILRVTYNFETFIIYQFYFLVISGNIQELKNLEFDLYIFSLSRLCAIIVFPSLYIFFKIIFPIEIPSPLYDILFFWISKFIVADKIFIS